MEAMDSPQIEGAYNVYYGIDKCKK